MYKYTISDIHGCLKTLEALLKTIQFSKADELYLLGDYIDRGPDSKGVFDFIWSLQEQGYQIQCLRGNHEQLLLDSSKSFQNDLIWKRNGGVETLASFGANTVSDIPLKYRQFMENLPLFFEVDNYILVHAGLNFDHPQPLEAEQSMMWIRNWYRDINYDWLNGRIIIHGHTPVAKPWIERTGEKVNELAFLDIDAGCVYPMSGFNHLCAFELTKQQLFFQANQDKPLR